MNKKINKDYPFVSIIIVNYNGKHLLKDCLLSLYDMDYPTNRFEVIVVDNGSTDGSKEYINKHFSSVKVLNNQENNYCKANNLGIKEAKGDYIALLNNDTRVDKNWLRELVKSMMSYERIGCCGGKVLFPDGKIQSTGHYEFPNFYWGDRGLREIDIGQYEYLEEVKSLSGVAILFRRNCLEEVGFFDEDFVMYLEDVDMFIRCKQHGWKLLYVPKAIVYHKFHGTADESLVRFYVERNRLLVIAKHFPFELSRVLNNSHIQLSNDELFRIIPDILLKLIGSHKIENLNTTLDNIFNSLYRRYNLSKDKAIQELNNELKNREERLRQLEETKNDLNANLESKTKELEEIKEELNVLQLEKVNGESILKGLEEERNRLLKDLGNREEELNQLRDKVKELEIGRAKLEEALSFKRDLEVKLESKTKELEEINAQLNVLQLEKVNGENVL
ncbi:MAG: glycosyltransferase, partial [Candidatus Omnitrophica bacterium]|nr:glycosyltransferase [Candidatus Omnitrophota bacterium]